MSERGEPPPVVSRKRPWHPNGVPGWSEPGPGVARFRAYPRLISVHPFGVRQDCPEDLESGLAAMRRYGAEAGETPVVEAIDLFVFSLSDLALGMTQPQNRPLETICRTFACSSREKTTGST